MNISFISSDSFIPKKRMILNNAIAIIIIIATLINETGFPYSIIKAVATPIAVITIPIKSVAIENALLRSYSEGN